MKKEEWLKLPAKRAMIDLGAAFSYSDVWHDVNMWSDPKLNGPRGWHQEDRADVMWLEVDMPGDDLYQVSKLSW